MTLLPDTDDALVVRTDFSDDSVWELVTRNIQLPVGDFRANVHLFSDADFDSLSVDQLIARVPDDWPHEFFFVIDSVTCSQPDQPVLVVDCCEEVGRTFRVVPACMWEVENNLSLANMDFEEFVDATDPDGVFRGFPES